MSLLVLLFIANSFAAEKIAGPTILWAFSSAGDKNPTVQSSLVTSKHELFRLYYRGLDQYSHSLFVGTMPKIENELRTKKLVCFPGSSEYLRRREFAYLTPQYIQPAPKLVMKKSTADKLLGAGSSTLKLRSVFSNKDLKGVVGAARSFGSTIDEAIAKSKNVQSRVFETFRDTALQLIEDGKADYTVEYGFLVQDWVKNNPKYADIVTVTLNDVEPTIIQYLACSKTPEGLAVITAADRLIRENIHKTSYWTGVTEAIPVEDRMAFQKLIDKYIQERAKAPQIIK